MHRLSSMQRVHRSSRSSAAAAAAGSSRNQQRGCALSSPLAAICRITPSSTRLFSSSYEASIPRGTRIQSAPAYRPGGGGGGGRGGGGPSRGVWAFLGGAVALLVTYLAADYWWMNSPQKKLLDARSSRPGFPLPLLLAMRDARLAQEAAEEQLERMERSAAATQRRQQQRQHKGAQEQEDGQGQGQEQHVRFRATAAADELSPATTSDPVAESAARALVSAVVPELLEAERLYRVVLSTHLSWRPIDLAALRALVESGSPTPQQAAVGEAADPAARRAAANEIEDLMNGAPPTVDRSVLPYVLSLLAHNLHCQARVLQLQQSAGSVDPSEASAATALRFRQSEQAFLQSLTLYRHHFAFDPRPYSVGVLQHLGTMYFDAGDRRQAERVWMRAQQMLAAARRALDKWQREQQQRLDDMQRSALGAEDGSGSQQQQQLRLQSELTDPAVGSSFSAMGSELSEKLALLHRERGDYENAVAWDQDALREWDDHATEQRARGGRPTRAPATPPESLSAPAPSAAEVAMRSLPRAMHLLTSLAADLALLGQPHAALDACEQSLQVLQRVVELEARARGELQPPSPPPEDESQPLVHAQSHQAFLSPAFTDRLLHLLQSRPAAAEANKRSDASAPQSPVNLDQLRAEAAAAYYNLAVLLRSLQSGHGQADGGETQATDLSPPASSAATPARASPDAKRAMLISRQLSSNAEATQLTF